MKTVHEISAITGISVRTLHYYDEIGLLRPTGHTGAGYRLYDDKALETLRQILFFREFGLPLRQIQAVLNDPAFDKNKTLEAQRSVLVLEKQRLERLIAGIDGILKGDDKMDFSIFSREEIEQMISAQRSLLTPEQRQILEEKFGGPENFRDYLMQEYAREETQRAFEKMVDWYGSREELLYNATHPLDSQIARAYGNRMEAVMQKLRAHQGQDVHSFAVKEIIGEYEFVIKQFFRIKEGRELLLRMAESDLHNPEARARSEEHYGKGFPEFRAAAIRAFYRADEANPAAKPD